MAISSEITRINGNIAAAYTALEEKGATLPASDSQNSANLASTIATVSTGGGGGGMPDALNSKETKPVNPKGNQP